MIGGPELRRGICMYTVSWNPTPWITSGPSLRQRPSLYLFFGFKQVLSVKKSCELYVVQYCFRVCRLPRHRHEHKTLAETSQHTFITSNTYTLSLSPTSYSQLPEPPKAIQPLFIALALTAARSSSSFSCFLLIALWEICAFRQSSHHPGNAGVKVSPLPVTDWHSLRGWFQSPQRKKFRASAVGRRMASLVVWWQAIQYTMQYLHMVFSFEALGWIWSWADLVRALVEEMVCLYFLVEWRGVCSVVMDFFSRMDLWWWTFRSI